MQGQNVDEDKDKNKDSGIYLIPSLPRAELKYYNIVPSHVFDLVFNFEKECRVPSPMVPTFKKNYQRPARTATFPFEKLHVDDEIKCPLGDGKTQI